MANTLGRQIADVVDDSQFDTAWCDTESLTQTRQSIGQMADTLHVFRHRNADGLIILEFEPSPPAPLALKSMEIINQGLSLAAQCDSLQVLAEISVREMKELTGFDQVALYRITSHQDGEVLAASGHEENAKRCTAQHITRLSLGLQRDETLRFLADATMKPIRLRKSSPDLPDLHIGKSALCEVDPEHADYWTSQKMHAAMSLALTVDGAPWGIIACQNRAPTLLPPDVRLAAELFAKNVSLEIKRRVDLAVNLHRRKASGARSQIQAKAKDPETLWARFPSLAPTFQDIIPSDGLAIRYRDGIKTFGSVPSHAAIRAVAQNLDARRDAIAEDDNLRESGLVATDELGATAGALVIKSAATESVVDVIFFRDAIQRGVTGTNEAVVHDGMTAPRLSEPWDTSNRAMARVLQAYLNQIRMKAGVFPQRSPRDIADHQRHQDLKLAELNHRVKNTLALIRSLSRQARASTDSLESYTIALEERINALSLAQDLALNQPDKGVSLRSVLELGLVPYKDAANQQAVLSGPPVGLTPDATPLLALVLHEVITNAAKHGALSSPDGIVRARWSIMEEGLRFEWHEIGARPLAPPTRDGFGRKLIEKAIPFELDGKTELTFEATGLLFAFDLPKQHLSDLAPQTDTAEIEVAPEPTGSIAGKSALLVEDNMLLAMDMSQTLTRIGAAKVQTVASLQEGVELAKSGYFDFAVVDVNLRGDPCFPIADQLKTRAIPFIFVSGFNSNVEMPASHQDVTLLTKPVDEAEMSRSLQVLLSAPQKR